MSEPGLSKAERLERKNAFDGSLIMGVSQFNRATGRDRHRQEQPWGLVDRQTGIIKAELARERPCPVCANSSFELLFIKAGFPHGRCQNCGLIYVSPVLTDQAIRDYYQQEVSWVQVLQSGTQIELDRRKYQYGLALAAPYVIGPELLDIGAGTGLFMETAAAEGFNPMGIELNQANLNRLQRLGFHMLDRPLEAALLPDNHFDMVTMWEVLEHIVQPQGLLREVGRVLRPGGLLLILVPNVDSLVTRLLHEKSGTFGGHSHINHFNLRTISTLLGQTHYVVLEAETIITELGTINNYLDFQDPYLGQAKILLDCLTPELIHDHFLGSKLLVLAKNMKEKPI